ncbi:cytochrome P450 [Actinosynnema sp. NPDC047251]|uniref:Cytochrome P450 family protein n=1 Tax=Saccharothrix espanaensis (strain ATCC 51144 / DSM 44229 / JCM 9112 / NBRC 15066 / NRRL 15764) TaxID=1179773 RepID=K0K0C7_SACES|nr:cytochrome P450 [Saccharothrix espanaensis]CCH31786.1 Cytochrome P450 family protein [Saccharothrix espanaensis DSM 44229]
MDTAAPDTAPPDTAAPGTAVPELDPAAVARWRESGGELVDLLTAVRRLGGVSGFRLGDRRVVLVTAPEAVHHVLALHPDRYVKRSHRLKAVLGDGMIAASGERWRTQRRVMQAQFTGQGVRRYDGLMRDAVAEIAARWTGAARTGEPRDVAADMRHFSLDVIWRSMTGRPLDPTTHREFLAAGRMVAALPAFAPATGEAPPDLTAELAQIDAVAARAIAAAREWPGPSLLHVLLAAAEEHPEYTERLIRDELVTLLAAGYETTATTLSWLFLLLHENPAERDRALATPPGSAERGTAIRALISETLRLYPAAWIMPRHAEREDVLAGYRVEAGTTILTSPYLTHRDDTAWPDPERFRPDRFAATAPRPAPGAYYPFGLGPRTCLGVQFGLREMTLLLETLLPAFTVVPHTTPAPTFGVTVRPDGPLTATITPVRTAEPLDG